MMYFLCMIVFLVGAVFGSPPWGSKTATAGTVAEMVLVQGGVLRPFYPPTPEDKEIPVKSFYIDKMPVTNESYLNFVKKNPVWQKDKVKKIFSDKYYLSHWASPVSLKNSDQKKQPVTYVSWFAAKAYCEAAGKRLPTEYEWEYAGQASLEKQDASQDLEWRKKLLDVYSRPVAKRVAPVGSESPNYYGVFDMHTLVWEWVSDFNGSLLRVDSREGNDADKMKFCGASALDAIETEDYPSFIRMAYRSSLKASYSTAFLGFRCAKNGD